jgi:hypothetical protein
MSKSSAGPLIYWVNKVDNMESINSPRTSVSDVETVLYFASNFARFDVGWTIGVEVPGIPGGSSGDDALSECFR